MTFEGLEIAVGEAGQVVSPTITIKLKIISDDGETVILDRIADPIVLPRDLAGLSSAQLSALFLTPGIAAKSVGLLIAGEELES